jgi:Ser/Thr protein kinase RdoA (MazF antagonist)
MSATLARDAAVPFRDDLLDGEVVGSLLGRHAGDHGRTLRIGACACVHAKYRAGLSLRTVYRLEADGAEHWLAARSFDDERAPRVVAKAGATAVSAAPLRPVLHVPALGAVFWTFPNDRKIAHLGLLADPSALGRLVGRSRAHAQLVAWAAERAATARCHDDGGRVVAYAKVFAAEQAAARVTSVYDELARQAASAGPQGPALPRVVGASAPQRALALEPMAGRPLLALTGAARAIAFERLGAALAVLHGLAVPSAAAAFDRHAPRRLHAAARALGHAQPAVAGRAAELAEALERAAGACADDVECCLHGDAHPGNVILDGARIALVDLDLAARGPAAADLGLTLAGLCQQRLVGRIDADTEALLRARLLAGYAGVRALPAEPALAWHTAAWLLTRPALPGAVAGRLRHTSLDHLPALVGAAWELPWPR